MENYLKDRTAKTTADTLHIYRARVFKCMGPGDDRMQVRIIPHMADIKNTEALPIYPMFFKGQNIATVSESNANPSADLPEVASVVWVVALPDFTVGYVLGPANNYESTVGKYSNSYNYKDVIQGLVRRGLAGSSTKYEDLMVTYWNNTYMEFSNIKTGEKYMLMSNGNAIVMTSDQIYMRVGAESNTEKAFSELKITKDEIHAITKTFRVSAKNVVLGDKGLHLAAVASILPLAVEGATFHPQLNIKV